MSRRASHRPVVLAACDFSMASAAALAAARRAAALLKGDLFALHVVPSTIPPARRFHALPNPALLDPGARAAAHGALRWLVGRMDGGAVRTHALVEEGHPADVVLQTAERLSADLLVVGKHGRGALARAFVGSTAEAVLRRARCPVLFVPPSFVTRADWPRTALWATDFSRPAFGALALASAADTSEIVDANRGGAAAVRAASGRRRADLVVVGAPGRGRLATALFGSTALDIVRSAACPVLVAGRPAAGTARNVRAGANPSDPRRRRPRLTPDRARPDRPSPPRHAD
jgi:nucleotide-binding universal stress UspA family protein